MPQYRVLQKSFIDNKLVDEGEIIEYHGEVSDNLELIGEPVNEPVNDNLELIGEPVIEPVKTKKD